MRQGDQDKVAGLRRHHRLPLVEGVETASKNEIIPATDSAILGLARVLKAQQCSQRAGQFFPLAEPPSFFRRHI